MKMARKSYDELVKENKMLASKVEMYEFAGKRMFIECHEFYVSIPLNEKQKQIAKDYYEDRMFRADHDGVVDGERRYEHTEDSIFAEFPKVLLRYRSDAVTGEQTTGLQVFGLIPV
jgi:hypothetical protein